MLVIRTILVIIILIPFSILADHSKVSSQTIEWSPDRKTLAAAGSQGIWLYDENLSDIQHFDEKINSIYDLTWSNDGQQIIAITSNSVQIWDPNIGDITLEVNTDIDQLYATAFSSDNAFIAVSIRENNEFLIKIYDLMNLGKLSNVLSIRVNSGIRSLKWSLDNEYLVGLNTREGTLIWWERITGEEIQSPLDYNNDDVIKWSPSTRYLAIVSRDADKNNLALWDTFDNVERFNTEVNSVFDMAWSPDETQLAYTTNESIDIIDTLSKQTSHIPVNRPPLSGIVWQNDNILTGWSNSDGSISIWDTQSGRVTAHLASHSLGVNLLEWSPDDEYLAVGSGDQTSIRLIDPDNGDELVQLGNDLGHAANDIGWSFDGQYLAVADQFNTVKLWTTTAEKVAILNYPKDTSQGSPYITWHPSEPIIATSSGISSDSTVVIWNFDSTILDHIPFPEANWLAFGPEGNKLVLARNDGSTSVWNMDTQVLSPGPHSDSRIAWHPSVPEFVGTNCNPGSGECIIWLYDAVSQQKITTLTQNIGNAIDVEWHPKGQLVAITQWHEIIFWDVVSNSIVGSIQSISDGWFTSISWKKDGSLLALGNSDGSVQIWEINYNQ